MSLEIIKDIEKIINKYSLASGRNKQIKEILIIITQMQQNEDNLASNEFLYFIDILNAYVSIMDEKNKLLIMAY